jgi:hypothetical protein
MATKPPLKLLWQAQDASPHCGPTTIKAPPTSDTPQQSSVVTLDNNARIRRIASPFAGVTQW